MEPVIVSCYYINLWSEKQMDIQIACAQIQVKPGDPAANTRKALEAIEKAKAAGVDLLLLPELMVPGYLLGDLWEQRAFIADCEAYGREIIAATKGICVAFGNIATDPSKVNEDGRVRKYNAAFVAQDGQLKKGGLPYPFISKTSMPEYREFDDARYFFSAAKLLPEMPAGTTMEDLIQPVTVTLKGRTVKLGVLLCEDGWTDNYHYNVPQLLRQNGAQILCNLSCSPYTYQKNRKRHELFVRQARTNGIPLVYCNNVGIQNNGKDVFTYDGCSCMYDARGESITDSPAFAEDLLVAHWDPDTGAIRGARGLQPVPSDMTALYTALRYGAATFLQQLGIKKMTIGVSGGIDSAVTAAFYVDILGPENVLLVNMPSQYNSALTKGLAQQMAEALGTNYTIIPIQEVVDHTIRQFSETPIHNYGTGADNHLTVSSFAAENIQARDRGARVLAGLASIFGGGFSCNSNKAEMTVGYATFYGDIAGVLALIGDLWKHQVYDLGRYLNEEVFHKEVIPDQIFKIKPSAELSAAQTVGKGGDPLVYPYHDYLLQAFEESWNKTSPEELLQWYVDGTLEQHLGCEKGLVARLFPTAKDFIADLERWWKLFCGLSVAKRIQAPPILAVSRRAYGYDQRESQLPAYYSRKYLALKEQVLGAKA